MIDYFSVTCGDLAIPSNAVRPLGDFVFGDIYTVKCGAGYELTGDSDNAFICGPDGTFDVIDVTCTPGRRRR